MDSIENEGSKRKKNGIKVYLVSLFPSSSQLTLGILHLLLGPTSVSFDLEHFIWLERYLWLILLLVSLNLVLVINTCFL